MNVIDDLKKLLATAEKPCAECAQAVRRIGDIERCGHQVYAEIKLKSHVLPLAQALVESQEALERIRSGEIPEAVKLHGLDACLFYLETVAALALRLDGLAKEMKR